MTTIERYGGRIRRNGLYIVALPQGLSPTIPAIVTGAMKRRNQLYDWCRGGKLPETDSATFRLANGRMHECQATGKIADARRHLAENPYSYAAYVLPESAGA